MSHWEIGRVLALVRKEVELVEGLSHVRGREGVWLVSEGCSSGLFRGANLGAGWVRWVIRAVLGLGFVISIRRFSWGDRDVVRRGWNGGRTPVRGEGKTSLSRTEVRTG
jgi:hypothetical protein